MVTRTCLIVALVLATGCGSDGTPGADAGSPDLAVGGDAARAASWAEVQSLLVTRAAEAGVSAFAFTVWDAADRRLYEYASGGFTADTRVAIASASKLVASLVVF